MILEIKKLSVDIATVRGILPAVRDFNLRMNVGEIMGIVGESGCGKSTAMLAVARLLPQNAEIKAEKMILGDQDITSPNEKTLLSVRGSRIAYIFQDPQASLNPVMKIGEQIIEAIQVKDPQKTEEDALKQAGELLEKVKIQQPETWLDAYPHQLSGGMKQRVMIAMALANSPQILIADEPTTSLDVTVQSSILNLLKTLNRETGMAVIFITHDLSVAEKLCDHIAVMYAGQVVETGTAEQISQSPRHPYTYSLWKSIPRLDEQQSKLELIPGSVPNPLHLPNGCKFHPRCFNRQERCEREYPELVDHNGRAWACFFPVEG